MLAPRQLALGEVHGADDHRQHVVEIVGDTAGQLAHSLHLLHLADLRFGLFTRLDFVAELDVLAHQLFLGDRHCAEPAARKANRVGAKQEDRQQRRYRADSQPVFDPVGMSVARGDGCAANAPDRVHAGPDLVHGGLALAAADQFQSFCRIAAIVECNRLSQFGLVL
ncbi:hypothetical protein [Mesorhizobium sp. LSJC255A00]|uniref:hypothetical protein n=1 Tax=Mesorhizobium sp. LSJC255A00 TaxID=1287313 RepID=UPI001FDA9E4A|nr:hypothetical protein [Mesorhizobium sp. LSJC255A00]